MEFEMSRIGYSIRLALRQLIRNKIYSAVIIISLALGIGANTAVFSVLNSLLLRPLPVKDVDRVAFTMDMRENFDPFGVAFVDAIAIKDTAHSFSGFGLGHVQVFRLLGLEKPERLPGAIISGDYLSTLGITASLGRTIGPDDDRPEAPPVAVISNTMWKTMFGSDRGVLGRSLNLDNRDYTVVGVLEPGFDLPEDTRVWVPMAVNIETVPLEQQVLHTNFLLARLRPGVSMEQANVELRDIASQLEEKYPQHRKNWGIKVIPLRQQVLGDTDGNIRPTLFLLLGIVGFLLLITCVNVVSLLLARSVERGHETAIKASLGAGKGWLIGQSLTESVLLSLIGGAIGLVLARIVAASMMALNPVFLFTMKEALQSVPIDLRVLGFTFGLSLLAGVIFGLAPVAKISLTRNLIDRLREGGQRTGGGVGARRLFALLMVGEIAVAMILVMGAGLMVKSFQKLSESKLGFRADHLLTVQMTLGESDYPKFVQRTQFVNQVLEKVRQLPGVSAAGVATNVPLGVPTWDASYGVEGKPADAAEVPITSHRLVSPDYLETLGVTLTKGRLINEQDTAATLPVVVVSQEFARRSWPDENPIGKRVRRVRAPNTWYTVIGVVDDVKEDRFNFRIDRPVWYIPYVQLENEFPVNLLVRTSLPPLSLTPGIREAIASVNHNQPLSEPTTMEEQVNGFLGPQRFTSLLSTLFAVLGLLLAAVGICGITAYTVIQRNRELCVRTAFGARPGDLVRLVLGRGCRLALAGLVIGLGGGIAVGKLLSSVLYQVSPTSPELIVAPALILFLIVLAAMSLPVFRLTRLDPVRGLRDE